LTLESAPGQGTIASLWLPISNEVPSPAEAPRPGEAEGVAPAGRVLVVDDEPLVRASTADMLTDMGYEVKEAESGAEALALARAGELDLVVTDHLMPGLSGTELAAVLRREKPGLPILIVSGYADLEGLPADLPRLTKPFRQADLAACVANLRAAVDTHCDD
jgi:CheY-like chemotaxis protein